MGSSPPTADERNANLDALKTAVDEFVQSERTRLENEVKFLRAVLEARGGAPDASKQNLAAAGALTQTEIDAFIVGG
jgi:hypothetical protein